MIIYKPFRPKIAIAHRIAHAATGDQHPNSHMEGEQPNGFDPDDLIVPAGAGTFRCEIIDKTKMDTNSILVVETAVTGSVLSA